MAKKVKNIKAHVSDRKKVTVKELEKLMGKKTIMVVSIKNLKAAQFQEIRKKSRGTAEIRVAKKNLIDLALEHADNQSKRELFKYVLGDCAIMFSDEDAFELAAMLADNKSPAKAKIGQISTEEIVIEPGPTELAPGPDISILSSAGLKIKIEGGKIAIQERSIFVKPGQEIDEKKVVILSKLGITPFKIGLEPIAAYCNGKIYANIKIDKAKTLEELKEAFGRSLAFAVSLSYPTKETLSHLFAKAASHEKVLQSLIKNEQPAEQVAEQTQSN